MTARVELDFTEFNLELEEFLDENAKDICIQIKKDAKASVAFKDKSGRLRKSIKVKKSTFEGGGYITKAGGPGSMQAWLVEHGHGPGGWYEGTVPPHPYLRPALDKNVAYAKQKFGVK